MTNAKLRRALLETVYANNYFATSFQFVRMGGGWDWIKITASRGNSGC
jgi:hypothetical protein